jgi:hypothetical protein
MRQLRFPSEYCPWLIAPSWAYFQFFRISACISLAVFHGLFVVVARRGPEQVVQQSEVAWSRWFVFLQSRCSSLLGSLAQLCHTQVRKLSGPCIRLAEASELAGPGAGRAACQEDDQLSHDGLIYRPYLRRG